MKILFGLMLILSALPLWAGEKGNGGDAVVCRDLNGNIISAELLDYYEGRTLRNLNVPDYPGATEDLFHELGMKLKKLDPEFLSTFEQDALILWAGLRDHLNGQPTGHKIIFTNDPLTDIPDSDELILKQGCKVEQLAIHTLEQFPEDPAFIIQEDILKKLDLKNLRGLVIHEMLYSLQLKKADQYWYQLTNSVAVRYMHQKLMSKLASFDIFDYLNVVEAICHHTCKELPFYIKDQFYKSGSITAKTAENGEKYYSIFNMDDGAYVVLKNDEAALDLDKTIEYGKVQMIANRSISYENVESAVIKVKGSKESFEIDLNHDYTHSTPNIHLLGFGIFEVEMIIGKISGHRWGPVTYSLIFGNLEGDFTKSTHKIDRTLTPSLTKETRIHFKVRMWLDENNRLIVEEI